MIYARSTSKYATDIQLFQFQRLEKRVLCAIANFNRRISVREIHMALRIPYVYGCITKLRRKQRSYPESYKSKRTFN